MRTPRLRAAIALACLPVALGASAAPEIVAQGTDPFQAFVGQLRVQALAQGITEGTVNAVLPTLYFSQRVVDLDRAQPGGPPNSPIPKFAPYAAQHVDAARIGRGRAKYRALLPLLQRVETDTGVPEAIMVAIWGHSSISDFSWSFFSFFWEFEKTC